MRTIKHMNFGWQYAPNFVESYLQNDCPETDFTEVNIPHSNIELPYNNFDEKLYQFESCYRKKFDVPTEKKSSKLFIHFDGVMTYAKVYVNGTFVGEHKGGYTPFKLDITSKVQYGEENLLVVYVDSHERNEIPPFGFVIDYLTYGGIYCEVRLEYTSDVVVDNCFIKTSSIKEIEKNIDLDLYIENYSLESRDVAIQATLLKDKNVVKKVAQDIHLSDELKQKHTFAFTAENVALWDINDPELYTLEIKIIYNDVVLDNTSYRFGFREVEFKSDGFYLNGKKLKLRGLNRHQSYPYVGYAMPKSAQYKDAEILKEELGVNTVRLSHYPQTTHFLDRCDELGILVFDEIPGWQHIGDEGEWWEITKQHTREMIMSDWNHPSIFIWGVRINESQDCDKLYMETNAIAKSLDDTRPTGGVRCFKGSNLLEDVYTYNDFIYDGEQIALEPRKKVAKKEVPYLITEYNGHKYSTKKFDDEGHRAEHAMRHIEVLNAMYKDDDIAGCIGWCMFDYNTHKDFGSGDKICYHGVLDMFRIPKYAAASYASQQDDKPIMEIASSMEAGDMEGSIRGDVTILTNCDYIKLYINDTFIKQFYPLKDKYPSLPHPPVVIDDFIGDLIIENEKFSKKDACLIKQLLIKIDKSGGKITLLDKLKLGYIFVKYKMNMLDGENLYLKYFGGWGSESTQYRFEGYKANECVLTKTKSQVFNPCLEVNIDNTILTEDNTYDVTRFVVKLVDENGDDLYYANDAIKVETEGPIEVIGPKMLSLIGGSIGFWVKTTGVKGDAEVKILSERFGVIKKQIKVLSKQDK